MMSKQSVNVSIVVANYNNGQYLNDFFNSIQQSSLLPLELIFIDDGSTDKSLEIISKFRALPYLKLIKFEKNRGFCNALNAGIETAKGKYIMRIDPDDVLLANRIAAQVSFLESHKDVDVVGSNVVYFSQKTGKDLMTSNFPLDHNSILREYKKGDHGVLHGTTLIRSSAFKNYTYDQGNYLVEDYDIFARMINDGHRFANIKEPLMKVRIHGESAANDISFHTIKKTFELRDKLFGTTTSALKVWFYYCYMLNYRKFLASKNKFANLFFLGLAVLCQPGKLLKRVF